MSSILQPIVARLRAVPSTHWEAIAAAAGVAKTLPRKLATGDRMNPTVATIQPLIDYFGRVDAGELPFPPTPVTAATPPGGEQHQEASHAE